MSNEKDLTAEEERKKREEAEREAKRRKYRNLISNINQIKNNNAKQNIDKMSNDIKEGIVINEKSYEADTLKEIKTEIDIFNTNINKIISKLKSNI